MKLLRFGPKGHEKPGVIDSNGDVRDLSTHINDITGATICDAELAKIARINLEKLPKVDVKRYGPCVANVGKFICIGLNYSDHAEEADMIVPTEPLIFAKATSAICGPNDDIEIPRGANTTDWEVELGVVIGKTAKYIDPDEALEYVAGYCVINDVSERDFQLKREGQWTKGKSADTFGPIGPWLVTRDEIPDPQNLKMYLDVNGMRMQTGSTTTMVYNVAHILSYLSKFMSLQPGDIVATGTPPGVGIAKKPIPIYLKPGDSMQLGITGLGQQNQKVVQG
ncbi:MAG: fumarylacetoacetate hydrolase family protein [Oceanospirillaceae bacterium]|nr:fumarylacetoacetate hydrolase family protein [Oceanospirillaceae bacterium]